MDEQVERAPRYSSELVVHVSVVDERRSNAGPATVRNVSAGGLLLESSLPLAPREVLGIEIPPIDSRPHIRLVGEVRWSRAGTAGLSIRGMLPNHRERYEDLLESLAQRDSDAPASRP